MHAILLAGQPNRGLLQADHPEEYEAEIPVGGRPMGDWILDALTEAPSVTSIGMVGPASLKRDGVAIAPMTGELFGNILQGLSTAPEDADKVLFVTGDIPWVTPQVIEAFLQAAPEEADVVYPVIPKEVAEARFPGTKRTYVRLREGTVTGGNLFVARIQAVPRLKERAEVLLAHRKSPVTLARDVGVGLLLKLVTGRVTLPEAERRVGGLLGIRGRAVIFPFAEAGVDVDKPEDLLLAERELASAQNGEGRELL